MKLLSQPERGFPAASVKIGGEIAFVDSNVSDLATLLAGLREGVEVVMLDPSRDALAQIAEVLGSRADLSAVHIIANGATGRIAFGSGGVDLDDLASHAADLAVIGAALGAGGDLMLWACDTGAGALGQAFVDAMALATGVDVAASTNKTGASARGGDWVLELHSGAIEAGTPLTPWGVEAWSGLLDAPTALIDAPTLPTGGEVPVNTTMAGAQQDSKITALEDGGYVVVWSSTDPGFTTVGVYAQLFEADGTQRGGEFLIDLLDDPDFTNLSVSALEGGGFVVAWQDVASGLGRYVAAQRFDALGDAMAGAVQVTAPMGGGHPVVAALTGGGYVVTWLTSDGAGIGVHAQVFDATDTPLDSSFIANATTAGTQTMQYVAGLADGGFVITWTSFNTDSDFTEVYAQRFDATGDPVGGEFLVPTAPTGDQSDATVTGLPNGGFVITWTQAPTFSNVNVSARLYDASGNPVGNEFAVTTPSVILQGDPMVTAMADGGFLISWQANDGTGTGDTYVQRYDASGGEIGSEVRVTEVTLQRHAPVVAGLMNGGFALSWTTIGQDGDGAGIYSRAFAPTIDVTEQVAYNLKGGITLNDIDDSGGTYTVTLSVTEGLLSVTPGTSGAIVDDSDPQNVVITGTLAQIQALLGSDPTSSVTYTYDTDYPPLASIELGVAIDDGVESATGTAIINVTPVNDAPYLDLDFTDTVANGFDSAVSWQEGDAPALLAYAIELDDDDADNSYDGATVTAAFTANGAADDRLTILSVGDGLGEIRVDGGDIYYEGTLVGSFTGGTDGSTPLEITFNADACLCSVQQAIANISFSNVSDTPDETDRTVSITFVDGGGTANGGTDTASANVTISVSAGNDEPTVSIDAPMTAVAMDDDGLVNTTTLGSQQRPTIAALEDGGYVVVWASATPNLSAVGIYAQLYDFDGTPRGGEFLIDQLGAPDSTRLSVSALDGGGFVVSWQDVAPGLGRYISVQRFDPLGDPMDVAVQVTAPGGGTRPIVTGLTGGGYAVTWLADDGAGSGVLAQVYDNSDAPVGAPFVVNATTTGTQRLQHVASLADGGFVAAWTSFDADSSFTEVFAQRFDAAGNPVGGEFLIPTGSATGDQNEVVVTGLANGGFVITWTQQPNGADVDVHGQLYDSDGNPVGGEFTVNTTGTGTHSLSAVTATADGGFLVSWQANDGAGNTNVYAQLYDGGGAPLGGEFRVTDTTGDNQLPAIAGLANGSFVFAWQGRDGSGVGVYSQLYTPTLAATEQVELDLKGRIAIGDPDAGSDVITVILAVSEGVLNVDAGGSGVTVDDSDQQNIILTGTLAQIQALLDTDPTSSVTYTYDDDYLPVATIQLSVTIDDGYASEIDTVTIDLTPVNDAAELDLDFFEPGNDAVATYFQGDGPTYLAYYASFDDDNEDWDGATLTVAITGATADDQITIEDVGNGFGEISVSGNQVFYEGDLVGTFTGGANGDPLVITFNAEACACAIDAITYGLLYEHSGASLTPGTRDVTFTFVDGDGTANGGADTATATVELTLFRSPSPPVIDTGADASGGEDSAIALTGIEITDAGDAITGLITVHLAVANGTITIRTDVSGGIGAADIIGGANGSRMMTITGTPAEINATLAAANGLTYQGDAEYSGSDELTISAHDGAPGTTLAISSLSAIPFGTGTTAVAVADIDGDLLDDLILGLEEDGFGPGAILILSSNPGGAALPLLSPEAFAFGDFDGDSQIDIAFAAYDDGGAGYVGYLSSDTGDVQLIASVPYALDLVAADFNGDGLMDLAAADSDNGRVGIIMQTSAGVFAAPDYSASSGVIANGILTGDFNGDGETDLLVSYYGAVGSYAPPGSVAVMLGNGDGTFGLASPVWSGPSNVGGIVVGDFNGDGIDDFAFASIDNSADPEAVNGVQVAIGNGDGTFADPVGYTTTATGEPQKIIAGDLNGDGILDLLVTNFDDPGTFSVLVGNGDGSFQTPVAFDTGDLAYVAAMGDFDGDGDLDIIIGNYGDGTFEAFNNDIVSRGATDTKAITINPIDDASDANDDAGGSVAENATIAIDVRGNDTDIDSAVEGVAQIDGQAIGIGGSVTLTSGARVTLNANGTLTYNPNGAFNGLISAATSAATGAVNTSATDSFAYSLAGGGTANVTVTVTGVQSADDRLGGDGGDNSITGTGESDIFMLHDGGDDAASGGTGIDRFYMGSALSAGDQLNGGAGKDLLELQGNYAGYTFSATNLVGIEGLTVLSGSVTTYSGGPGTARYDYNLTTLDMHVAAGQAFLVDGSSLLAGEDLRFDGSAETNGRFHFKTGAGDDTLIGGALDDTFIADGGADTLTGGGGNDVFRYLALDDSRIDARDTITDFTAGDRIGIWALGEIGGLGIRFIGDGAFTNRAGELRVTGSGTSWLVQIDTDGDGDADFGIDVTTSVSGYLWGAGDFM